MGAKLRRNCATYEAYDPKLAPAMRPATIQRLVEDAVADIGTLVDTNADLLASLKLAEDFMAGFEDDELQDGINRRLETIRLAIANAEALT